MNKNLMPSASAWGWLRTKQDSALTRLGLVLFAVMLSLLLFVGVLLYHFESGHHHKGERDQVQQALDSLAAALTNRIYSNIYKVSSVKALVAMNPDLTQDEFARAMEVQFREQPDLRNIGLARDMVIQYMYPITGNEAAIGLDYRTLPNQFAAVDLARRVNQIVLAGPLELVQGGEALVARIPISVADNESGQDVFWGFASVVINSEAIFAGEGITEDHEFLRLALRGRDARGPAGEVFFGDPSVFTEQPASREIDLPYGSWQIAAVPVAGWSSYSALSAPLLWVFFIVAIAILAFSAFIVYLLDKFEKSVHERNLLNRSMEVFLNQTSDFIYYKDIHNRFIFCSQALANFTQHERWQDMVGKHDFEVFPDHINVLFNEDEQPVLTQGKALLNKVRPCHLGHGEIGFLHTSKWPVFDENKQVSGIFGISRDITELKKAVDALEQERNIFTEGPVFTMEWETGTEGNWRIRNVSSNVTKILGYRPAELLQPDVSYNQLIHPDDIERIIADVNDKIANRIEKFEQSYRLKSKSGTYLWLYDFTRLVRNPDGNVIAMRGYLFDQSAQKNAEAALRVAEAKLERTAYDLTENIPVGTYTMVQPAEGGMASFAFMSSRFLELTGLTREQASSDPLQAFRCLHPDDFDDWVALNAKTFAEKLPFYGEARVIINGETRWITAESTPRTLADGTTVWEGVLADITDRKRAEQALSESLQRFNDLVAHVSVGVYVFWVRADGSVEFEYVSDGWCAMNHIQREEVLRDPMLAFEIIHPDEIEDFHKLNHKVVAERTQFSWEGRLLIDGKVSFAMIESSPVFFDSGDSRWFGIQKDITERKKAEAILYETNMALEKEILDRKIIEEELKIKTVMLEKISMQDALTQIPNRRHYDERGSLEWKRALRTGLPLSLVMMDIDHFKLYNDHYGHGAGDDCLREVAQALLRCCDRPLDLLARYGGEEFVALLPETEREGALHLAEQMRAAVENLALPHALSSTAKVVTLSVGFATHAEGREKTSLQQLQTCADQALYLAKHSGRNQVQAEERSCSDRLISEDSEVSV